MAPTPSPKPKPGAVPIWAWGAAAAAGLIIGFVFLRPSNSSASADDPVASGATGSAPTSEGSGGGAFAIPPELLAALGLRTGSSPLGSTDNTGTGSGSGEAAPAGAAAAPAAEAPASGGTGDPILDGLISRGYPIAPEGATVEFRGTTYPVGGQPEFSPGNFNPNSPAGVLAMNGGLYTTPTVAAPGAGARPPDFFDVDNQQVAAAQAQVVTGGLAVAA